MCSVPYQAAKLLAASILKVEQGNIELDAFVGEVAGEEAELEDMLVARVSARIGAAVWTWVSCCLSEGAVHGRR